MLYFHIDDFEATALAPLTDGTWALAKSQRPASTDALAFTLSNLADEVLAQGSGQAVDKLEIVACGPSTLVPSCTAPEYYSQIFASCYASRAPQPRRLFSTDLDNLRLTLLHAADANVAEAVERVWPTADISWHSPMTALINNFATAKTREMRRRVCLHMRRGFVDAFAFDDRRLTALATYALRSASDATYYAVALTQNLGLCPATTPYVIFGLSEASENMKNELVRFAPKATVTTLCGEFGLSPITNHPDIPFALAAHVLCAL